MTKQNPTLILIDGSAYLYRAYHALPALTNSKGEPTGAIYGVINMIRKLRKDYNSTYFAVVFDSKRKTFRDEMYPEYKATRPPTPDELSQQVAPLFKVIEAMGLPLIIVHGVEADDVIGTLTREAESKNLITLVSTSDKDLAQLVNDKVTLINTMSNYELDRTNVNEKFGVTPEQIIDYLSLIGDTSDNIPGIPKVGPKTAAKWLNEYQTLDNIIKHADEIKGKVGENLRENLDQLALSKKLVTIKDDVDLPIKLEALKPTAPNNIQLRELFQELEFKSWLSELIEEKQKPVYAIECISTEAQFQQWHDHLKNAKTFSFDTETNSLNAIDARLVGISVALDSKKAAYIPLNHDYDKAPAQLDQKKVLPVFKTLLADKNKTIIGQNLKYDMTVLHKYQIELTAPFYDTMLESYVLNSTASRHDMDSMALKYLGKKTITFEDVAGKGAKQLTFNQVHVDKATEYAGEDALVAYELHEYLWPKIKKQEGLSEVLKIIELPLVPVLSRMESHGVLIDEKQLSQLSQKFAKRLKVLEEKAYQLASSVFNLSSTKQLQEILFTKLKLPISAKTPKGLPSTGEAVLQTLALEFPLPKIILEHRSLSKLKSTYTDKLPRDVNKTTGRVHTSYNQAVTSTGRLSSTNPNLQNIPARTTEGRKIRQAFIAPSGYKIISADYSQIELRIIAHLSDDKGLKKAFMNNHDIHKATASEVFGVDIEAVTPEQRRKAKAINFGLIYGMSSFGLSKQIGVKREVAQAYIDRYFERYPGVREYILQSKEKARQQGYVETWFGRRLYVPDINASNFQRRSAAERIAINAPMQGTAADIIKLAMIELDKQLLQHDQIDATLIMQVHDELIIEVAEKDMKKGSALLEKCMTQAVTLNVPIYVEIGVGDNWDEAHS